jgi:hypothetical protein
MSQAIAYVHCEVELHAAPMPTLAAPLLANTDRSAGLLETAIWCPDLIPAERVTGWADRAATPPGWTVVYGATDEQLRQQAAEYAHNLCEAIDALPAGDLAELWAHARERLARAVGQSWADVTSTTAGGTSPLDDYADAVAAWAAHL